MMRSVAVAAALVLLAAPGAAQRPGTIAQVQKLLDTSRVFCGRFEQAKTLVGVRQPVRSEGRFCVAAGKGILWRTLHPFASSLLVTPEAITEMRNGEVSRRLSAADEPGVRMIDDLLFSLLGGDLSRLEASFDVTAQVADAEWSARLVPRASGMRAALAGIDLHGGAFVRRIVLREAGGDVTTIGFSAIAVGASAMQPEEAHLLE